MQVSRLSDQSVDSMNDWSVQVTAIFLLTNVKARWTEGTAPSCFDFVLIFKVLTVSINFRCSIKGCLSLISLLAVHVFIWSRNLWKWHNLMNECMVNKTVQTRQVLRQKSIGQTKERATQCTTPESIIVYTTKETNEDLQLHEACIYTQRTQSFHDWIMNMKSSSKCRHKSQWHIIVWTKCNPHKLITRQQD